MVKFNQQELEEDWISEQFIWRVDTKEVYNKETYKYSREFVKSLGLESDAIGWCTLEPKVDEQVVKQIYQKSKEEKVKILASYELSLTKNYPTDWYILTGCVSSISRNYSNCVKERYIELEEDFYSFPRIKGYKIESFGSVLLYSGFLMIQKPIVDFFNNNGIKDLDYMWVEDFGKYRATPYFLVLPKEFLKWCFSDKMYDSHKRRRKKEMVNQIRAFGSKIELIWKKSKILRVTFPMMVSRQELKGREIWGLGRDLLVSKKVRDLLLQNGLVEDKYFKPVFVSDRDIECPPKGLGVKKLEEFSVPNKIQEYYYKLYEKDLRKNKPQMK